MQCKEAKGASIINVLERQIFSLHSFGNGNVNIDRYYLQNKNFCTRFLSAALSKAVRAVVCV